MLDGELISTEQAAALLEIKPATLYAYVSRGLIRSLRASGNAPSSFLRTEIEDLARRRGRRGQRSAPQAQHEPSAIVDERLLYRGQEAARLALAEPFEAVAEWLWCGERQQPQPWLANERALSLARQVQTLLPPETLPLDRFSVIVPTLGAADPLRLDLSPRSVILTGRGMIAAMVESLPLRGQDAPGRSIAERLWPRLTEVEPTKPMLSVLDAALVLLTDHGSRPRQLPPFAWPPRCAPTPTRSSRLRWALAVALSRPDRS